MKSIYTYYDYRRYISDYYAEKKTQNPNYSFRYIAGKVGIDHALIVKIMQGDRHIGSKKVAVFALFLGLSERQTAYFNLLVAFGKAKSDEESRLWFERILAFSDISEKRIEAGQYEYYQRWYYTAVREILNIRPFKDDYQWLANAVHPPISVPDAKKAVRLLENIGLVKRGEDGFFRLTDQFLTTGDNWQSIAVKTFQKEACALAAQAIDQVPRDERDISTVTVSLDEAGFSRLRDSLSALRREIVEVAASCQKTTRAYQVNLQLFPVSAEIPGREEPSQ
jgi:uncharacterized protein (TIGR02147 family)